MTVTNPPKRIPIAFQTSVDLLTPCQTEVLVRIAKARTVKQIAGELGKSPKTVEYHLREIYRKTKTNSMVGAAIFAIREGYVRIEGIDIPILKR